MNVLFTPTAVNHLFRAPLTREKFNSLLLLTALGATAEDEKRYSASGDNERDEVTGMSKAEHREHLNHQYLLRPKMVNELTAGFTRVFDETLADELAAEGEEQELELYKWLRCRMFKASTEAFFGKRMLQVAPDLEDLFFDFDKGFLTMFFGIPRFVSSHYYNVRDSILDRLDLWHKTNREICDPSDPDGPVDWEPIWGSRANRARQLYYERVGMSRRGRASLDLGFLFGASSNALPATAWTLFHLLDPKLDKTVLPRVMEELDSVQLPDGSTDLPALFQLPLLNSIFYEILRLYVDVLVTREVDKDVTIPLEEGKNPRTTVLKKGGTVVAPSWLGHRDAQSWSDPVPYHVFHAERFLRVDPETGKSVFSTSGSSGKLFPFGGGKTICPGRVFAKQEVFASLACILLTFEMETLGFVNEKGQEMGRFPALRDGYTGSGVIVMDGDVRVRMRRRMKA